MIVFCLENTEEPLTIRMTFAAANQYVLDIKMLPDGKEDYDALISELCQIAPVLLRLDADLAQYYDDAGRTKPSYRDLMAVRRFREKYAARITEMEGSLAGMELL